LGGYYINAAQEGGRRPVVWVLVSRRLGFSPGEVVERGPYELESTARLTRGRRGEAGPLAGEFTLKFADHRHGFRR